MKRTLGILLLAGTANAQTIAKLGVEPAPAPGILQTKVFLITGGGALKPARLGSIIVLSLRHGDVKEDTVGQRVLDGVAQIHSSSDQLRQAMVGRPKIVTINGEMQLLDPEGINRTEMGSLLTVLKALAQKALELTSIGAANVGIMFVGSLDEEGVRTFPVDTPGSYLVLVSGQAGANVAFWMEKVQIASGQETSLKLSRPLVSYLR